MNKKRIIAGQRKVIKKVLIFLLLIPLVLPSVFSCSKRANKQSNQNVIETVEEQKERESADLDVIEQLKKAGSNFSKQHNIEHHFFLYNNNNIPIVTKELQRIGYMISDISNDIDQNGKRYWHFNAIKISLIKKELIFNDTKKMNLIAKKYNIIYDGWGTKIVK